MYERASESARHIREKREEQVAADERNRRGGRRQQLENEQHKHVNGQRIEHRESDLLAGI